MPDSLKSAVRNIPDFPIPGILFKDISPILSDPIHQDAIQPGEKVLIIDDLLATGGTASATVKLVKKLGAEVINVAFLIELNALDGRANIDAPVSSIIQY